MRLRIVLRLLFCIIFHPVHSQNWDHYTVLDDDGIFHLYWNIPVDKRGDNEIPFKMEVKTKGYFGFGFSPDGSIPGSDIVTGCIHDGEVHFKDRHADTSGLLLVDNQQDYELIDSKENETYLVFEFRRKLDTCDENDLVIKDYTMRIIYGYSDEVPASEDAFYLQNQGSRSIILLQSTIKSDLDLNFASLLEWNLLAPDIDISSVDTTYSCRIVKSPQVSTKHHIVYIKPVIQEGHEQFLHHMGLYECPEEEDGTYENLLDGRSYECSDLTLSNGKFRCQGTTVIWALGGEDIVYPEHVGVPLAPAPGKYYMFEMHYDNPELQTGIIDHSGLTLYYTPDLREFDAGNYLVGTSMLPRVFIPPAQKEYTVVGHSAPECVSSFFPDNGAKIFGIGLYTFMIGRSVKVRHFRGQEELTPLADGIYHDPRREVYKYYTTEVPILQNDHITIECTYDSSERRNVTFVNGPMAKHELCLADILYYPRVNRFISFSAPPLSVLNNVLNTSIKNEEEVSQVLGDYNWENVNIREVEDTVRMSEHLIQCYLGKFMENEAHNLTSYPNDFVPFERESTCDATM